MIVLASTGVTKRKRTRTHARAHTHTQTQTQTRPGRNHHADAFTSGFMAGLIEGQPLACCARMGCALGAMAAQTLGSELDAAALQAVARWGPVTCAGTHKNDWMDVAESV